MSEKPGVVLDVGKCRRECGRDLDEINKFRRITNFLAGAQLYLKENVLLQQTLTQEHLKERLLGHWGTCPGLNLAYAHCNYLIKKHDLDMFFVTGPGHGAPAILANLFIEGSLQKYYPEYELTPTGVSKLVKNFSWPGGFPNHVNAQFPGSIHEGGELGYSLSVAFGAVMDNPNLIVTCVVGDGEAETGPLAASWNSYKFIDPKIDGAVLPILHLNGWKMSSPSIYGTMSDAELVSLFTGFGYLVRIVSDQDIDADMAVSMEWALNEIRNIQRAAREGRPIFQPKWPLLIMKTPKGWTGIKWDPQGNPVEVTDAKWNHESFKLVNDWLYSYYIRDLLDHECKFHQGILDNVLPRFEKRMGMSKYANPIDVPLTLPNAHDFGVTIHGERGTVKVSATEVVSKFLQGVIQKNTNKFRIFSPDELTSNRLEKVLEVTKRNYQWVQNTANQDGRVLEVLSEHLCQGWMQGYTLTGRTAMFPSYEAFLGVVTSMMAQYAKFIKVAKETGWRHPVPSINYISTSTHWRQEHNDFSHQDPIFVNNLLNMKSALARIYFPPDANCFLTTLDHILTTKNYINLIVGSKHEMPVYLSYEEAVKHTVAGVSIWKWFSTDEGRDPDVILVGIGAETTQEVVEATKILKKDAPQLRVRMINITDLMVLDMDRHHPHALSQEAFDALFTEDKDVIFNFHGYPSVLKQLLFKHHNTARFHVLGYKEEGTTTTPFKMLAMNKCSRYHVAKLALKYGAKKNAHVAPMSHTLISGYRYILKEHDKHIKIYGKDPENWEQFSTTIFAA
jgi:xylulose-5-phosphate/fructose-6-phosphate phosphoketolase